MRLRPDIFNISTLIHIRQYSWSQRAVPTLTELLSLGDPFQHSRLTTRRSHRLKMSSNGEEVEVEVPTSNYPALPKDVQSQAGIVRLFGRWDYSDVEVRDISLTYERNPRKKSRAKG